MMGDGRVVATGDGFDGNDFDLSSCVPTVGLGDISESKQG